MTGWGKEMSQSGGRWQWLGRRVRPQGAERSKQSGPARSYSAVRSGSEEARPGGEEFGGSLMVEVSLLKETQRESGGKGSRAGRGTETSLAQEFQG